MKHVLFLSVLFSVLIGRAATISGTVTNAKGQPLAFASVSVKGTNTGAVANGSGKFSLTLHSGNYTLVCEHVGYQKNETPITVSDNDFTLQLSLAELQLTMAEVVIKSGEDPAVAIMRQAIAKREFYRRQTDSLSVDVYIKGLVRSVEMPDKILGQKLDKDGMQKNGLVDGVGKGILFLSESLTKVSYVRPEKFRFDVVSSRGSGGGIGFSFPFFISFYTTNVQLFNGNVNPRGFVSPLADGAFHYYKFRFEGSFFEGDKMIDRIRVMPRRKNEPLFDGYVQIVDGEWRIHSLNLLSTKSQGLDLLDSLRIMQTQIEVAKDVHKTGNQVVSFSARFFGFGMTGDFLNVYSNYNLSPRFEKKTFNRILLAYDSAGSHRDTAHWTALRPVPLEADELRNFSLRDSLAKAARDSMRSKRYTDSVRRLQAPVSVGSVLITGVQRAGRSAGGQRSYLLEPLLPNNIRYNTIEGTSVSIVQSFGYVPTAGKRSFQLTANLRYGFGNTHVNPFAVLSITPKTETYPASTWTFTGGKRVLQFNRDNPIGDVINTYYSLLGKRNYQKLYEARTATLDFSRRSESGFGFVLNVNYEDRFPLRNNGEFPLLKKGTTLLPNHPFELAEISFERHSALVATATLRFQPGQKYIKFPDMQLPLGSSAAVFELQYAKGLPSLFNSVADFDKWRFTVSDDVSLRLAGTIRYRVGAGGFFNRRRVDIPDFTHFNGNQTFLSTAYLNSFQLAPYYRYSNTERMYAVLHAEHHLNGLLTNKIPLLNKLKWNLVTGTNTFYVNSKNYYTELFFGLENIFKVLRVDLIKAYQAAGGHGFGVRVGAGGILGGLGRR